MSDVLLIYPYSRRRPDRSRFRFPPLGPAYVAASMRQAGHHVRLLDCTFLGRGEALARARHLQADVVGVYAMATLEDESLAFARALRGRCGLLVAGGPLPTCEPERFLGPFDAVVRGEGESTLVDLLAAHARGDPLEQVPGVVTRGEGGRGGLLMAPPRPFAPDLDALPFPARDLLPNAAYIAAGRRAYGHSITTVMSTRGCPFTCEFCSNVVFGASYRARSAGSVVDEVEEALALGYDRISFADDVFTLDDHRVLAVCDEIERRGLRFSWECLGRAERLDGETARRMRAAGCFRVFFGIESGDDRVLRLMDKRITAAQARRAVENAHRAGLEVGAFFILCYPGDTDESVLRTIRYATSLPLDYAGLSMPYPLPGTALLRRVGAPASAWRPQDRRIVSHERLVAGDFSAAKMRVALLKARAQVELKRRLGRFGPAAARLIEGPTDRLFRAMR